MDRDDDVNFDQSDDDVIEILRDVDVDFDWLDDQNQEAKYHRCDRPEAD